MKIETPKEIWTPELGANAAPLILLAIEDVTEQKLRQAQKMEAMGTLTGGIARDVNNIFTPIIINSELALLDTPWRIQSPGSS